MGLPPRLGAVDDSLILAHEENAVAAHRDYFEKLLKIQGVCVNDWRTQEPDILRVWARDTAGNIGREGVSVGLTVLEEIDDLRQRHPPTKSEVEIFLGRTRSGRRVTAPQSAHKGPRAAGA